MYIKREMCGTKNSKYLRQLNNGKWDLMLFFRISQFPKKICLNNSAVVIVFLHKLKTAFKSMTNHH